MNKVFLCNYSDIDSNDYVITEVEDLKDEFIIFLNTEKEIKIFSSVCPHFGGEIIYDKGKHILACKWHGYEFCSDKGGCLTHPVNLLTLTEYNSLVENDKVFLVNNE